MTELLLRRYSYAPTETEGYLYIDDDTRLHTIERPWRGGAPGGMPFYAVPDGTYSLEPFVRPNGDRVLRLFNEELYVYREEADRPDGVGRFLCLIHAANRSSEVQGCVAPGMSRIFHENAPMVTSSRKAMALLMQTEWKTLHIIPACGTEE